MKPSSTAPVRILGPDGGPKGEAVLKPFPDQPVSMTARKVSNTVLVNLLLGLAARNRGDKTDLPGEYDFKLSWNEEAGPDSSRRCASNSARAWKPKRFLYRSSPSILRKGRAQIDVLQTGHTTFTRRLPRS